MAQFIHLTDERLLKRVVRNGIRPSESWGTEGKFVFATPVTPNFLVAHQWLRELKRRGIRTVAAVQFRIDDDEPMKVGRFGKEHLDTTAAGAMRIFQQHESGLGLQVLIPRKIQPKEIMRAYVPPQLVGWRYYPEAHGKVPCACPACQRGEIKSQSLRRRLAAKRREQVEPSPGEQPE